MGKQNLGTIIDIETGQVVGYHSSSDDIAASLGKDESEFMAEMQELSGIVGGDTAKSINTKAEWTEISVDLEQLRIQLLQQKRIVDRLRNYYRARGDFVKTEFYGEISARLESAVTSVDIIKSGINKNINNLDAVAPKIKSDLMALLEMIRAIREDLSNPPSSDEDDLFRRGIPTRENLYDTAE